MTSNSDNGSTAPLNVRIPILLNEKLNREPNKSALVIQLLKAHYGEKDAFEESLREARLIVERVAELKGTFDLDTRSIALEMVKVSAHVESISKVVRQIFGLPISAYPNQVPTFESFSDEIRKAATVYQLNPDAMSPKTEPTEEERELNFAAYKVRLDNLGKQLELAFHEMPFMQDGRFYWGTCFKGFALYDRNTVHDDPAVRPENHFPVIWVRLEGLNWSVSVPNDRPYFLLKLDDKRPHRRVSDNMEELIKVSSVIVADYVAYRRAQAE